MLIAPVTVDDFVAVNLAREKMPRKSTWFTPKARGGLVRGRAVRAEPCDEPPPGRRPRGGPGRA